jgi:hypothetical protein
MRGKMTKQSPWSNHQEKRTTKPSTPPLHESREVDTQNPEWAPGSRDFNGKQRAHPSAPRGPQQTCRHMWALWKLSGEIELMHTNYLNYGAMIN